MRYMNYNCIPATFCISRLGTAADLQPVWYMRFAVHTAVLLKIQVFWDMTACHGKLWCLNGINKPFLKLQWLLVSILWSRKLYTLHIPCRWRTKNRQG